MPIDYNINKTLNNLKIIKKIKLVSKKNIQDNNQISNNQINENKINYEDEDIIKIKKNKGNKNNINKTLDLDENQIKNIIKENKREFIINFDIESKNKTIYI